MLLYSLLMCGWSLPFGHDKLCTPVILHGAPIPQGIPQGLLIKRSISMASVGSSDGHNSASVLNSNWNLAQMAHKSSLQAKPSRAEALASSAVRAATKVC